jgi:septum formation inhibitor MinC
MNNEKRGIKKCFCLIIVLLTFLMIPSILSGMEADKTPKQNSMSQGKYVLEVKGDNISLKAKDASLKDILEELGRRMKIEVIVNIPRDQKITTELDMMYLEDALKRFKTNYAYITKTGKQKGSIIKIVVVPKGGEKMLPNKYEYNPQPPIQEFNPQPPIQKYDPQPPIKKSEHEPQPTTVRSEHESQSSPAITENESQSSSTATENESQTSSAVTENESQSSSTATENESESSSTATESESQSPAAESNYDPQPSITEKK